MKGQIRKELFLVLGALFLLPFFVQAGAMRPPEVKVYDARTLELQESFFAYDEKMQTGVSVALGDVGNDGIPEIVVAPGYGYAPLVRVFRLDGSFIFEFFAYNYKTFKKGLKVSVENGQIIPVPRDEESLSDSEPEPIVWQSNYRSGLHDYIGGVNLANNGKVAAVASAEEPKVKTGDREIVVFEEDFYGGVNVAANDEYIVVAANYHSPQYRADLKKVIRVDLSDQRIYLYEDGYLVRSFLVSTGIPRYPTPQGEFKVTAKLETWLYVGPGYYLPNTKWNLRFTKGITGYYYIHGAYWHNNFGKPMSHGCVNVFYPNAEWIYHWADIDTPIFIEE